MRISDWSSDVCSSDLSSHTGNHMADANLCSEEEITTLVHGFYDRVRADGQLGPIFNTHVQDWDTHLAKMVQFWSSLLRGTGSYHGTPMPIHAALPGLNAGLFPQLQDGRASGRERG